MLLDIQLLEWFKALAPIVLLIVSALLAVAGYFAKKTIDGFGEELKLMRGDHETLEKDFLRFQAQLPRVYVLKDDHIRHITIVEKKIDDLASNTQRTLTEHANTTQKALASIDSDIKMLLRDTA